MAASTVNDPVQAAFEQAMREFKIKLGNNQQYDQLLQTTSIDEVYDATDKLQEDLSKTNRLQNLAKIQPFLERLRDYAGVIDTFVQAKPDILALIWGPIKLLLQVASKAKEALDAIINAAADIGALLPEFKEVALLFDHNTELMDALVLFFHDILDFYLVALRFFNLNRWRFFFESLWPARTARIKVITGNLERHTALMRNEVRLEHIRSEHDHRVKALEHFDKAERSQMQAEYYSIKLDIDPQPYDAKLDWFNGRFCQGTCKWLARDPAFVKWMDQASTEVLARVVWLKGIPGAGKTFLSGTAINTTKSRGRTIFAFLSHNLKENTTALTVVHSLVFQLASTDDDLKTAFCHDSRENLKNSLDQAVQLLTKLLNAAGSTSILIDGVDEVGEIERARLLRKLVDVVKNCAETRLFLSSRNETDIARHLEAYPSITVDGHNNAGSIQAFVTRESQEWFLRRADFLPEHRAQIKGLLAPVAYKANGMFLYAKVLFSLVEHISDVNDIYRELEHLPENLHAAYARILKRINSLPSEASKRKARLVLSWVSCSPKPMTVQELAQALEVDADYKPSVAVLPSILNVSDICGPIVEVVDNYVQFVHFTAKEYLCSPKTTEGIDADQACLSLVICCLKYLCQDHHDEEYLEEETDHAIMIGAYRFHDYAVTTWLPLIESYLRRRSTTSLPSELTQALESFVNMRSQRSADGTESSPNVSEQTRPVWLDRQDLAEHLREALCRALAFQKQCLSSDFQLTHGAEWTRLDPFTTCHVSISIHERFKHALCPKTPHVSDCSCADLQARYGPRLFKCGSLSCTGRRHGFVTRTLRDKHSRYHTRPWKCAIPGCEYADIGFLSRRMRNEHLESAHQGNPPPPLLANALSSDVDEIQPLLFDLVATDNLQVIITLLPAFKKLYSTVQSQLMQLAAKSGSVETVRTLLMNSRGDYLHPEMLEYAVSGENFEVLRWYLHQLPIRLSGKHGTWDQWAQLICQILQSNSAERLFQDCEEFFADQLLSETGIVGFESLNKVHVVIDREVIKSTQNDRVLEGLLIRLWEIARMKVVDFRSPIRLGDALSAVANTTCSLTLAKVLLEWGAAPDARRSPKYLTPLHHVVRSSNPRAAEMAKFLLYRGASPEATAGRSRLAIREEIGAKEVSKWLGVSWEELVEQVERDRKDGVCPPEYF